MVVHWLFHWMERRDRFINRKQKNVESIFPLLVKYFSQPAYNKYTQRQ